MRKALSLAVATIVAATALPAQTWTPALEVRTFGGGSFPIGSQRDFFKDGSLLGLQGAVELKPSLHVVGSFSWVDGKSKYDVSRTNVDIFQYDLGVELAAVRALDRGWQLKPFVGLGAGARTYEFSSRQLSNRTCSLAYGAVGSELQFAKVAVRLEARDNVFCYRSPIVGQESKTRNDLGLSLGVAYHLR
jgi:hypothetical protein